MQRDTQLRGERRWTAVLCADLVDFTGISRTLGAERTYELMRDVVGGAREEIEIVGGHIIEYAGDALFAVFGAPTATENASLDACRAALAIQTRMDKEAAVFAKNYGMSPKFRIGLAGGSVVFGSLGQGQLDINVLGDAVNLAMRLQKETPNGTVICSDAIYNQVEGFVEVESFAPKEIKGLEDKHVSHRVDALMDDVSYFQGRLERGAQAFFGRDAELAALKSWFIDAPSAMIDVSGPAGVGKSRLIHEFVSRDKSLPEILVGQCNLNIQQTSLAPVIEILRKATDCAPSHPRAKIEAALGALVSPDGPAFDYLVNRIGGFEADPTLQSNRNDSGIAIRALCEAALTAIAKTRDVVFLIEDSHWIDTISETVISALSDPNRTDTNCRFLVTRRSHIPRVWTGREDIVELPLDPLTSESVKNLILVLLDVPNADDALISLVDEKSERNPLFVEEIVRYLQFSGAIEADAETARLATSTPPDILSGNLQHLVLSRFDALPQEDRKLLRIAAARGRQFSTSFLESCAGPDSNTAACISRALEAGLIEDDPSRVDGNWRFSHALIGDAIYDSLLGPQRRDIHALIADVLENSTNGRPDSIADELAFHFQAAGNAKKAVHYLWLSAELAYQVFSVIQVDEQLDRAFALIEAEPDLVDDETFGQMLFLWGRTMDVYGNFHKLHTTMEHHIPRLREGGASELLSLCLSMKALARCHTAEFERAQIVLDEALAMAKQLDLELPVIWAKVVQMRINVDAGTGDLKDIAALYEEVKPVAEQLQDSHMIQISTYTMMTAYRVNGAIRRANEYLDWLVEYGTKNNSNRALAMSHWARCVNHLIREEFDEAIEAADDNLRLTVPPTADWRVATVGRILGRVARGDKDASPDELLPHVEILNDYQDTSLGNVVTFQYWINTIRRGQFHRGLTGFLRARSRIGDRCSMETRRFVELVRAEILMSVAGAIPSSGTRSKMGLMDILTGLRLKIGALKNAEKHLKQFQEMSPSDRGYFIARVMRNYGLIEKRRGNLDKARDYLSKSVALYEAEEMFEAAMVVEAMMDA